MLAVVRGLVGGLCGHTTRPGPALAVCRFLLLLLQLPLVYAPVQ